MNLPKTVNDFVGPWKPSGTQRCYKHCPVCGNDRWHVYLNPETGGWMCFAGEHSRGGFVNTGFYSQHPGQEILDLLDRMEKQPEWGEIELPPFHDLTKPARWYLRRRGIDDALIAELGLVEMRDSYRIIIPYFDPQGQLIYWTSRRYSDMLGKGESYENCSGIKHPLYLRLSNFPSAIVVEGFFDAIRCYQAGFDTIALGGKTVARHLRKNLLTILENYAIIYVMLDEDALREIINLTQWLLYNLRSHNPVVPILIKGEDPGSMSTKQIRECVLNARIED